MSSMALRVLRSGRQWRDLLARWQRLSRTERRDLLLLALLIPSIRVALLTVGFRRVSGWIVPPADVRISPGAGRDAELALALRRARRYAPYRGNCLSQSLALLWVMRRSAVPAALVIGARLENGQLLAHAWVECNGVAVNDSPDVRRRFAPFGPIDHTAILQ